MPTPTPHMAAPGSAQNQQSDMPTMRFTSTQRLFRCIYDEARVPGDVLTVTDVSPANVAQIDRVRDARRCKFRLRRYDSATGILTVAVPTYLHDALYLELRDILSAQFVHGGIEKGWKSMGAASRWITADSEGRYPGGGDAACSGGGYGDEGE